MKSSLQQVITMKPTLLVTLSAIALLAAPAYSAEKIKIGYITTLSGPGGVMGKHHKDGAELALEQLGGKIGGKDAELIFGDDQQKPDVGRQVAEGMIKRDQVNFVSGVIFSNVMLAVYQPIIASKTIFVGASGGPHEIAGEQCSPYFFSTSWQNDQAPEAMGKHMTDAGVSEVYLMAPNFAAGKDMLAGFKRFYKGKIVAEVYTNFTQLDFQSELSQIRAANPKAVFVFYPGGMGIQFVKQYAQAGLQGKIPLYSVYTQNETTLPAIGPASADNYEAGFWSPAIKQPSTEAFVEAFKKKFGYLPSDYAAASYDAIKLIDSGVKAAGGDVSKTDTIMAAMRKADIVSVRGSFKFNNNQFPIENFYLFKIEKDASGNFYRKVEKTIFSNHGDSYADKCSMK
jgi:branched-chain amino acid transport system substrate-binding protein